MGQSTRSLYLQDRFSITHPVSSLSPTPSPQQAPNRTPRPFQVLGIQQIAIGGPSKGPLLNLWNDVLGVDKVGSFRSEKENVDEDILKLGSGPWAVEIDLMQPIDSEKVPKVHIPPLNHIGLWVHPLKEAYDYLSSMGVRFTPGGIRKGASGHNVCFIHPKATQSHPLCGEGVLIELVQAPPEVVEVMSVKKS